MVLYQLRSVSENLFPLTVLQPRMHQAAYAMKLNYYIRNVRYSSQIWSIFGKLYQTVSLKPNCWVISEVPATVNKQSATKASELLASATNWFYNIILVPKSKRKILKSLRHIVYHVHLENSSKKEFSSKRKDTKST